MNSGRARVLQVGLGAMLMLGPAAFGLVYTWGRMLAAALVYLLVMMNAESLIRAAKNNFPVLLIFSGLLAFLALQFFFSSSDKHSTLNESLIWIAWGGLFLLAQELSFIQMQRLLVVLLFTGLMESLYAFWQAGTGEEQVLWQAKEAYIGFVTGTYINRNHLAGFLEMTLGVATGFLSGFIVRRHFWGTFCGAVLWTAMLSALFLTGSRMGTASFSAALAGYTFLILRRIPGRKVLIWGLAALALMLVIFVPLYAVFDARLHEIFSNQGQWDGGRFLVWKTSLKMLKDYGWMGTGLGAFGGVFPAYQPPALSWGWSHAHNDYLELAVESGVMGTVLLAVFYLTVAAQIYKKLKTMELDKFLLLAGILLGLISLSIHGLADFNFSIPANSMVFIFLLACASRIFQPDFADGKQ